ncbi:MAG: hypothetical protein JWO59_3541 [Chloroflexi bacterium]|nr:hypothetical protein [Chloroflexota bacterium]
MAPLLIEDWLEEQIPEDAILYRRVPRSLFIYRGKFEPDNQPTVGAFEDKNFPGFLSTDWNRYATPQETQLRGGVDPPTNGVVELSVKDVRALTNVLGLERLQVRHTPIRETGIENRAHTDIISNDCDRLVVRTELRERCQVIIKPT